MAKSGKSRIITRLLCMMLLTALLVAPTALADEILRINKGIQDATGIEFFINLLDQNGNSIGNGLGQSLDSFDVWHNDNELMKPDSIDTLTNFSRGTHYYFCVDSSATVTREEIKGIQDGLSSFFMGLNPAPNSMNKASLWTFGEKVTKLVDSSRELSKLTEMAAKLNRDEQYTHLFEVIHEAVNTARNPMDQDNVYIIVITDGADDQGDLIRRGQTPFGFEAIKQTVELSGVPIYGIMLPIIPNKKSRNPNTSELKQLCDLSGGELLQMKDNVSELYAMLDRIRNIANDTTVVHIPIYNDGTLTRANEVFKMVLKETGDRRISNRNNYTVMNLNPALWPIPTPTPTATATTTPTPRPTPPQVTPTPVPVTATPTIQVVTFPPSLPPEPTPAQNPGFFKKVLAWFSDHFTGDQLRANWWMLAAAGILLVGVIILLVVLVGGAKRHEKDNGIIRPVGLNSQGNSSDIGTVRVGTSIGKAEGGSDRGTTRSLLNKVEDNPSSPFTPSAHGMPGTIRVGGSSPFVPTNSNGMQRDDDFQSRQGTSTVRMVNSDLPDTTATGTVRMISQNRGLEMTVLETRERDRYEQSHTLYLDKELYIGRNIDCDLVIRDENVSGRHLKITKETDGLYIADNRSTNGTKVNGEPLKTIRPLRSGDIVIIGVTTLKISFEED